MRQGRQRRVRQLFRSIRAKPLNGIERSYIEGLLNQEQKNLFYALAPFEQRHALNVCRTLAAGGFGADRELLQAALLHDAGKHDHATGRNIPIWAKVVNVGLGFPGGSKVLKRLANSDPQSWGYIFFLQIHHESRGTELAREAGSSEKVLYLLGENRSLKPEYLLARAALKWADDLN